MKLIKSYRPELNPMNQVDTIKLHKMTTIETCYFFWKNKPTEYHYLLFLQCWCHKYSDHKRATYNWISHILGIGDNKVKTGCQDDDFLAYWRHWILKDDVHPVIGTKTLKQQGEPEKCLELWNIEQARQCGGWEASKAGSEVKALTCKDTGWGRPQELVSREF